MREDILISHYQNYTKETPFDYAKRSFIGCGGVAKTAFYPRSIESCVRLALQLEQDGLPYHVLGNLSNVLPCDNESKKVVLSTKHMQEFETEKGIFLAAGVTSATLLRICALLGKSGAEFLAGVPCTIGGALFMNAGVNGRYIAEIVERVWIFKDGKREILSLSECEYAYKSSVFMRESCVILGASLRLENSTREQVQACIAKYLKKRAHLPKGKSMGCVFKNPQGEPAGKLIECAGLKGMRVGGARISQTHANFIINEQNATASDVKALIELVKNVVFAQYKIRLQEEIRYLD